MARVTSKYLVKFVNEKFKQLEINEWECYDVKRTHFTSEQYQNGACFLHIDFRNIEDPKYTGTFLCFYSMKTIQEHLETGKFELYLDFRGSRGTTASLSDAELNLRRI